MRTDNPLSISEANLSLAWSKAFQHVMHYAHPAPLVISFCGLAGGEPEQLPSLRQALDVALAKHQKVSVADNAAMLFPWRAWLAHDRPGRQWVFDRYARTLPRLHRRSRCRGHIWYGTYFGRMVDYSGALHDEVKQMNQLAHVLDLWDRGRSRKHTPRVSAMQVACFDPAKDQTGQLLRGFPCLQQVGFTCDDGRLAVHAFYPMQYIFDRGYGNYLGLSHLGLFMAHEMGLELARVTCYVSAPALGGDGVTKASLHELECVASHVEIECSEVLGTASGQDGIS